jgi:hypothetical protein
VNSSRIGSRVQTPNPFAHINPNYSNNETMKDYVDDYSFAFSIDAGPKFPILEHEFLELLIRSVLFTDNSAG